MQSNQILNYYLIHDEKTWQPIKQIVYVNRDDKANPIVLSDDVRPSGLPNIDFDFASKHNL